MRTTPENISSKSTIIRDTRSTIRDYENQIRESIMAASRQRVTSKLFFDFGDEGLFDYNRKTKKTDNAIDDMASAIYFNRCKEIKVFRNALKGVTIACK